MVLRVEFYLIGAVKQGEDVPFLHGDFARTFLLVVIESEHQLLTGLIISRGNLLLQDRAGKDQLLIHSVGEV